MYCCLSSCIFIHCSTGRMWMMGCLPPPRPSSVWPCRDIVVGVVKRARQWGGCVIRTIRECYRNFRRFLITKLRLGGKKRWRKFTKNCVFKARKLFSEKSANLYFFLNLNLIKFFLLFMLLIKFHTHTHTNMIWLYFIFF